ncbi:MAG: hypothetical protein Q8R13_03345 [bacterium]|nr:hypothetical protein [bacterium]
MHAVFCRVRSIAALAGLVFTLVAAGCGGGGDGSGLLGLTSIPNMPTPPTVALPNAPAPTPDLPSTQPLPSLPPPSEPPPPTQPPGPEPDQPAPPAAPPPEAIPDTSPPQIAFEALDAGRYTAAISNLVAFPENGGAALRARAEPGRFENATLFVCATGKAWCGTEGVNLRDLSPDKALARATVTKGTARLVLPVVASAREVYFEAMVGWIKFGDGSLAWLQAPGSPSGPFVAQDGNGGEVMFWAVIPGAALPEIVAPTADEKRALREGTVLPVRDLPVTLANLGFDDSRYRLEIVNPAAFFDAQTGRPSVRYLLEPARFDEAELCAVGSGSAWPALTGDIDDLDLSLALACTAVVDGRALLSFDTLPGLDALYPEKATLVVVFKEGLRGWGEVPGLPNGPFVCSDTAGNASICWVVDPITRRILEPDEVDADDLSLGRETPVSIAFSAVSATYTATVAFPAAHFEEAGELSARFLNQPELFAGARLCALGLGPDWNQPPEATTLQTFDLSKALACAPIDAQGTAALVIAVRPGATAPYTQDMIWVVEFSDHTRAWGEPPSGLFLFESPSGSFTRVIVDPAATKIRPPE